MMDVCYYLKRGGEGVMWICGSQGGGEVVGFVWAKWQLDIDLRYLYDGLWQFCLDPGGLGLDIFVDVANDDHAGSALVKSGGYWVP